LFNGTSTAVGDASLPIHTAGNQAQTISLWFKTSASSTGPLFQLNNGGGTDEAVGWRSGTGNLSTSIYTTSHQFTDASSTYRDGQWHFFTTVLDSVSLKLYVDGIFISENTSANTGTVYAYPANPNIRIGRRFGNTGSNIDDVEYFNGSLDQIKVYNYARTPAQIAWDYNRGAPVGWWKFDECSGGVAHDASGNGNNGAIVIGPTPTQTSTGACSSGTSTEAWNNGTAGKLNSSLSFDGADDYASASIGTGRITNVVTMATWVKFSALGTTHDFFTIQDSSSNYYIFYKGGGNQIRIRTNNWDVQSGFWASQDTWYYMAVTDDGTNVSIYINGVLKITQAVAAFTLTNTAQTANLGFSSTNFLNGYLDDVRVYNYGLTATQIRTLYNEGSALRFGPNTGAP
jgi:hypothetical protein